MSLVLTLSCSPATAPPSEHADDSPRRGGTAIVGVTTDISGINQLTASTDSFTQAIIDRLFLRLLDEQPDYTEHPPTFVPRLAESYQWSDDQKTVTLHLRNDVYWSDGVPVTAYDVEWTWQAQIEPAVAWVYAEAKDNILRVEALDEHTAQVVYQQIDTSQLSDLNEGVVLPKHVWEKLPFEAWRDNADWFLDNLVTNGPFLLHSWRRAEQIDLARNPNFFLHDRPYLDRIVFRIVPHKAVQLGHLLSGEVQFVDQLPAAEAARVDSSTDIALIEYESRQFDYICWNLSRPLFSDPEVRRALTMAIDRQALVDALWFGHARVATSPIISSVWAHDPSLAPLPYDPKRALEILAESGWSDSDGDGVLDREGTPFRFDLSVNTNAAIRVDAAILVQEQLRRVGIEARVQRLEFNTWVSRNLAHDFDATLGGWDIDTSLDLTYAFHSRSIDNGYNFGGLADERVDALIEAADRAETREDQQQHLRELQSRIHELQPYTFLWEPRKLVGVSRQLLGTQPNAIDPYYRLEDWWLVAGDS